LRGTDIGVPVFLFSNEEKSMAKRKRYRSLPKRIVGVKVPKALRRYADTPLGSALIAETMVEFGKEALFSPAAQRALGDIRASLAKTTLGVAAALQHAAESADSRWDETADRRERKRKRRDTSARLEQEELSH
jgi:hypothetical protein